MTSSRGSSSAAVIGRYARSRKKPPIGRNRLSSPRHAVPSSSITSSASVAAISSVSARPVSLHSSSGTWTQRKATTANARDPSNDLCPPVIPGQAVAQADRARPVASASVSTSIGMQKSSGDWPRASQNTTATAIGKYNSPSVVRSTSSTTRPKRRRAAGRNLRTAMIAALPAVRSRTGQSSRNRNGNDSVSSPEPAWSDLAGDLRMRRPQPAVQHDAAEKRRRTRRGRPPPLRHGVTCSVVEQRRHATSSTTNAL